MKRVVVLVIFCWAVYVRAVPDFLLCSEYLVSGSHGVNDTALTASSYLGGTYDEGPRNGRLYYPGDDSVVPIRVGSWLRATLDTGQYIQVTFPVDTIVTAVTIQGRYKDHNQWVTSYYVLHSMDEVTWTTVTSNGSPLLFSGSTDMNTPVTSSLTPNITVRHLRINPQTWEWHSAMRFDVSGCQIKQQFGRRSQYAWNLVKPMDGEHTVFGPIATSLAVADCAKKCHFHGTCMSFTHQTSDVTPQCTGHSAWIVDYGTRTPSMDVFIRQDMLDIYDYKLDQEAAILYNIVEARQDQGRAAKACTSMYTRLMVVDTLTKMEVLNRIITEYFVLKQDFRFFVAGTYTSSVWSYTGNTGDVIDGDLWSDGNPDQGQGQCVMLTETGLASVDCQEQLFSICGN